MSLIGAMIKYIYIYIYYIYIPLPLRRVLRDAMEVQVQSKITASFDPRRPFLTLHKNRKVACQARDKRHYT